MTVREQQFELIIEGVLANGYAVCDDFLDKIEVQNLLKTFDARYQAGKFKEAGIGKQSEVQQATQIRGDEILWLENESEDLAERVLLDKNQAFVNYLNQTCYLGIKDAEIHLPNTTLVNFTAVIVIPFRLKKEEFYPSFIT
jgi:SM-20-related protein